MLLLLSEVRFTLSLLVLKVFTGELDLEVTFSAKLHEGVLKLFALES